MNSFIKQIGRIKNLFGRLLPIMGLRAQAVYDKLAERKQVNTTEKYSFWYAEPGESPYFYKLSATPLTSDKSHYFVSLSRRKFNEQYVSRDTKFWPRQTLNHYLHLYGNKAAI